MTDKNENETIEKTEEREPCTGEQCTIEMCGKCHSLEGCEGAKIPAPESITEHRHE